MCENSINSHDITMHLVLVDRALGGRLVTVLGKAPHANELVANAVLLVVELAVVDEETEDDGRDRKDNGDDKQDVHVVVVGANHTSPFRGSDRVEGHGTEWAGVD